VIRLRQLALILFCVPALGYATDKNAGTSGAQFLKIGAGARPAAMGEAFVGIADDVNAVYYNPAGLAGLTATEFTAMRTQWFQDANYDFGAIALPTDIGVFGISAATLKIEDFEKRAADEGFDGNFDTLDAAYGLSYGRALTDRLSAGITMRYVTQKIDTASAQAWSTDLGILHRFENRPVSIGFAIRHLGQEVKFNEEGDPQPLTLDLGSGMKFFNERLLLGVNLKKPRDNGLQYGLGSEWNQPLTRDFRVAARAGYNSTGTDADGTTGISFGGGVGYRLFTLDFAWVPFGDLGNTMRYAVHLRF
jgi:hypothetical protein